MSRDTITELNGKSGQGGRLFPDGHDPFLVDVAQGRVNQFGRRFVAGNRASVLGQLAQAHVDRLDSVDRINHLSDSRRIVKERHQPAPVLASRLACEQVLAAPPGLKLRLA